MQPLLQKKTSQGRIDPAKLPSSELLQILRQVVQPPPVPKKEESKTQADSSAALLEQLPPRRGVILLNVYVAEGVGDYSHFRDFLREIRAKFPQYKVCGFIEAENENPSYQTVKAKIAEDFPDETDVVFCPVIGQREADMSVMVKKQEEARKKVEDIINSKSFVATLGVSCEGPQTILSICAKLNKLHLFISEHDAVEDHSNILAFKDKYSQRVCMGVDAGTVGVKLPRIRLVHDEARAKALAEIGTRNPDFFRNLTGEGTDPASAAKYLKDRHFMMGYLQGRNDCALFIATHVLKYTDPQKGLDKPCDFHLPNSKVDQELIIRQLEACGIKREEIAFVNPKNERDYQYNSKHKVRIFSNFIKDEEDWKLLFQVSKDGAAASGDNSVEQVYGALSLPFVVTKTEGRETWVEGPRAIAENLGLENLVEYFNLSLQCLCVYGIPYVEENVCSIDNSLFMGRNKKMGVLAEKYHEELLATKQKIKELETRFKASEEMGQGKLEKELQEQRSKLEKYNKIKADHEKNFMHAVAEKLSQLLKKPELQQEWGRLQKELTTKPEYNLYNWLPLLLTASIHIQRLKDQGLVTGKDLASNEKFFLIMRCKSFMEKNKMPAFIAVAAYRFLSKQNEISFVKISSSNDTSSIDLLFECAYILNELYKRKLISDGGLNKMLMLGEDKVSAEEIIAAYNALKKQGKLTFQDIRSLSGIADNETFYKHSAITKILEQVKQARVEELLEEKGKENQPEKNKSQPSWLKSKEEKQEIQSVKAGIE